MQSFYGRLSAERNDNVLLTQCIHNVVAKLAASGTSMDQPGMLLGKIQSGKTGGFLGIIAKAFDEGYDISLVLTKGTKTLAQQTVSRISKDFKTFIDEEKIIIFDIMNLTKLTRPDLKKKIIIVAKKEIKNLERVISFFDKHPDLKDKKVLLVDDEADMASVRFAKRKGRSELEQGSIALQLDKLRMQVPKISFLQVTATPYALYLQPESYDPFVYLPKKPHFTELLPIHSAYVGGDHYFGDHGLNDYRSKLFIEVPESEQNALRPKHSTHVELSDIWTTESISTLRRAVLTFLLATTIRRQQQILKGETPLKYSMIIHNDTQRSAHDLQDKNVNNIIIAFEQAADIDAIEFKELFEICFEDLAESVSWQSGESLDKSTCYAALKLLLADGDHLVQVVNSDSQVASLLDPATAELNLRVQANIFIGGSLLDRGITIPSLISFFYGRNPKRMQADTVLQHSRMYGARPENDLAVTRFYTSQSVFTRLKLIHYSDTALREAFEKQGQDSAVIFIENNSKSGITPCSPSKVAMSEVISVRPSGYLLPQGFDTKPGILASSALAKLDQALESYKDKTLLSEINLDEALGLIATAQKAISLEHLSKFQWEAMSGLLSYYSKSANNKVKILVATDRDIGLKSKDKSGESIVGGKGIRDLLARTRKEPALVLLRQNGKDWTGQMPFWWPVLVAPTETSTCLYAS
ncbi:Z1 domain-containing protein [Pseudomonas sp. UBA4034]|uniref:Z1 domain-containing protein n=1 Tax=Pseudomonas sp. UBA4034 TaxID=1947315 RepID=UPI00257ACB8E|nr:Z1 domain-containing protein [Pseudomonas sp. UBA4034]